MPVRSKPPIPRSAIVAASDPPFSFRIALGIPAAESKSYDFPLIGQGRTAMLMSLVVSTDQPCQSTIKSVDKNGEEPLWDLLTNFSSERYEPPPGFDTILGDGSTVHFRLTVQNGSQREQATGFATLFYSES
jgi:hypothetical protein